MNADNLCEANNIMQLDHEATELHDDVGKEETKAAEDNAHEQFFPARLHGLMELLEKDGLSAICGFQPHGRAFLVRDKKRFVDELLPKWFQQHRWTSFQRQLNIYNFKRITQGPDRGAYYHPHFLRGRRDLCRFIKRVKIKGSGRRKPACPEAEPDFYSDSLPHDIAGEKVTGTLVPQVMSEGPSTTVAVASQQEGEKMAKPLNSLEILHPSTMPWSRTNVAANVPSSMITQDQSGLACSSSMPLQASMAVTSIGHASLMLENIPVTQILQLEARILEQEAIRIYQHRMSMLHQRLTNESSPYHHFPLQSRLDLFSLVGDYTRGTQRNHHTVSFDDDVKKAQGK